MNAPLGQLGPSFSPAPRGQLGDRRGDAGDDPVPEAAGGRRVGVVDGDREAAGPLGEARPRQLRRAVLAAGAERRWRAASGSSRRRSMSVLVTVKLGTWGRKSYGFGRGRPVGHGGPFSVSGAEGCAAPATLAAAGARARRHGAARTGDLRRSDRSSEDTSQVACDSCSDCRTRSAPACSTWTASSPGRRRCTWRPGSAPSTSSCGPAPAAGGVHPGRLQPLRRRQAAAGRRPRLPRQPGDHAARGRRRRRRRRADRNGLGTRKNELLLRELDEHGVEVYPGSRRYLRR